MSGIIPVRPAAFRQISDISLHMDASSRREWSEAARAGAWFASLPDELAARLMADAEAVKLPAGQRLFARGDPPDGLYAVIRGVMRITYVTEAGQEALLAMLEPPHWFGEIALFDSEPRTHDAWAEADALVLRIGQDKLLRMLGEQPLWWKEFGRLLTSKLRVAFASIEEISLLPPTPRLARRLLTMAGGYGSWTGRSKRVLEVSQEQLGLMLALSRQTVNLALKDLEACGAIRRSRGSIEILDPGALARAGR
jgi:CRP/FNR family transcriptional regulator, cyclic AMP receptor protein